MYHGVCDDIQNLIEAILATIGDIHKFDNLGLEIARVGLSPKYAPGNSLPVSVDCGLGQSSSKAQTFTYHENFGQ